MKYRQIYLPILTVLSLVFVMSLSSCNNTTEDNTTNTTANNNNAKDGGKTKVIQLTTAEFKEKVFNYENNEEWNYLGELPCVVDFYADWCKPCRMVAPIMDELSVKYDGKIIFYKVDIDNEKDLAAFFGIESIPTVIFCPTNGSQPTMATGALSKEGYLEAINEVLKIQ